MKKPYTTEILEIFFYRMGYVSHRQAARKEEKIQRFDSILIKIALLCHKKDSYTDSVYSNNTIGTILTISQRFCFSDFTDLI